MHPDLVFLASTIQRLRKFVRTKLHSTLPVTFNFSALLGVTNNVITSQVATGLVAGLFPGSKFSSLPVLVQSMDYDSLEPTYSCRNSASIRSDMTTGSLGDQWIAHLDQTASVFDKLDKVSGFPKNDSAGWHASFDQ